MNGVAPEGVMVPTGRVLGDSSESPACLVVYLSEGRIERSHGFPDPAAFPWYPTGKESPIPNDRAATLPLADLLAALHFAADKHREHRRKDPEASPYINHPIAVAEVLARIGGVADLAVLQAAVLHDTIEDTDTTEAELAEVFGSDVSRLVAEVTDDRTLPKAERKQRQVEHAPHISPWAKLVKLGDKICNVYDIGHSPPEGWSPERRLEYLDWSRQVVAGCRGVNSALERHFDELVREGEAAIRGSGAAKRGG